MEPGDKRLHRLLSIKVYNAEVLLTKLSEYFKKAKLE